MRRQPAMHCVGVITLRAPLPVTFFPSIANPNRLGAEAPRRLPAALRPCYAASTGKAPLGRQKTLSSGISWVSA